MMISLRILLVCSLLLAGSLAWAELKTEELKYAVGDDRFTGYLAYDDATSGERPGVLVVHEWWGQNAYARKRAEMLAELGYTALAVDMYGEGKVADHPDDAKKFMQAVVSNMPVAEQRFNTAKTLLQNHPTVDGEQLAAIGYCFGGGIVLHMARAGAELDGVVSFHGTLGTEKPAQAGAVKAEVLAFTGADDPFAPPEQVKAFEEEMRSAGATYELVSFPGVKHSFTNPGADKIAETYGMPLAYDEAADKASWAQMQQFFDKLFE